MWGAHRTLAAAGRDLAAIEVAVYGEVQAATEPTIVVVPDLGSEAAPCPALPHGGNGNGNGA